MIRRWLFNVAAAVSLALCAGTVAVWVYSYRDDLGQLRGHDGQALREVFVFRGRLIYQVHWITEKIEGVGYESESEPEPWHWEEGVPLNTDGLWPWSSSRIAGFGYHNSSDPYRRGSLGFVLGTWRERAYWCPLWALFAASAILPLVVARRLWCRLRRYGPGLCPKCGYNLTGNTSGVCPECGTPVPSKPEVIA